MLGNAAPMTENRSNCIHTYKCCEQRRASKFGVMKVLCHSSGVFELPVEKSFTLTVEKNAHMETNFYFAGPFVHRPISGRRMAEDVARKRKRKSMGELERMGEL